MCKLSILAICFAVCGNIHADEPPKADLISEFLEWSLDHPECLKRIQRSAAAHGKTQKAWLETKSNITQEFNEWRKTKNAQAAVN